MSPDATLWGCSICGNVIHSPHPSEGPNANNVECSACGFNPNAGTGTWKRLGTVSR